MSNEVTAVEGTTAMAAAGCMALSLIKEHAGAPSRHSTKYVETFAL